MLFPSIDFAIFLPIVFLLYWFVFRRTLQLQNAFVLFASAVFYGWWDWRYLGLVFISAATDYVAAIAMDRTEHAGRRKALLVVSLVVNLGMLGFFKYYNFFVDSFNNAFTLFGQELGLSTLSIVLPVGISFYTFQTLSYTIDVYRKQMKASHDPVAFGAFILFFPQLVAGPIERASNLLPQFQVPRTFDETKARDGMRQTERWMRTWSGPIPRCTTAVPSGWRCSCSPSRSTPISAAIRTSPSAVRGSSGST
jgi:D-alanyl-lipoteichoic acid acyltransferase DltB (MBOAT superfamily)